MSIALAIPECTVILQGLRPTVRANNSKDRGMEATQDRVNLMANLAILEATLEASPPTFQVS